MHMTALDWVIVFGAVGALTWLSFRTSKYMRGVADFLSANRSAGRYMLTLAGGMSSMGAISAVAIFEQYYAAGFPTVWWAWLSIPAGIIVTLTGWVYYRFRETRCLTLAQFFEVRYSKRFRIFAGFVVWLSGILNFGIFPYVASNFFVYFCGLSPELSVWGMTIPTYWPIMLLTIGMALMYTAVGGQITVMITDCVQGIFTGLAFIVLCLFLLTQFSWGDIAASLKEGPYQAQLEKARDKVRDTQKEYEQATAETASAAIELSEARADATEAFTESSDAAEVLRASESRALRVSLARRGVTEALESEAEKLESEKGKYVIQQALEKATAALEKETAGASVLETLEKETAEASALDKADADAASGESVESAAGAVLEEALAGRAKPGKASEEALRKSVAAALNVALGGVASVPAEARSAFGWGLDQAVETAALEQQGKAAGPRGTLAAAAGAAVAKKVAHEKAVEAAGDSKAMRKEAKGKSMLVPFDTGRVDSFNVWFFLIMVFNMFYGAMSWQGSQAYQSSGISPHEQKMGSIIGLWRNLLMIVTIILLAICSLTYLTHPEYVNAAGSQSARLVVEGLKTGDTPFLATQQRVPIALAAILPMGLRGLFCVVMVFLLVTTQDTYLHSWGSIFVQDVIMPLRKKEVTPKQHVNWIRWSIVGVAAFSFVFACLYKPTEFIQMYFAITGAIVAGLGCAIVGGLYWRYAGTIAAYVAVGLGAVLSITRIVVKQYGDQIAARPDNGFLLRFFEWVNGVNSQYVWFFIMLLCITIYVILSLIEMRKPYNLDRMLHRGKYDITADHKKAADATKSTWLKLVGITQEFSLVDRILAVSLVVWNFSWLAIFFGATACHFLIKRIPMDYWIRFWQVWVWLQVMIGIPAMIWFAAGGIRDIKRVFVRLATLQRDDRDDGRIVGHHLAAEEDTIVGREDAAEEASEDEGDASE